MASEEPLNHTRCKKLSDFLSEEMIFYFAKLLQFRAEDSSVISYVSSHKEVTVNPRKKPPCFLTSR